MLLNIVLLLSVPLVRFTPLFAFQMSDILVEAATFAQDRQDRRRELVEAHLEAEYPGALVQDPAQQQLDTAARAQQRQSQITEGVHQRLESIGFRLGWCLAERWVWRAFSTILANLTCAGLPDLPKRGHQ